MNVAVTGRTKAVARASTATAWTAWTRPTPTFHLRREVARAAGRRAGSSFTFGLVADIGVGSS
jgi:hypothetical protein